MSERSKSAGLYFDKGYNCAQSVLLSFADELPISKEEAAKLASSFGGGMAGMHEVCGAVSAMFMAMGLKSGLSVPDAAAKAAHYAKLNKLAEEFKSDFGSVICRDLLKDKEDPARRLLCREYVKRAAEILEKEI
ncbi:MAG: C-GCAxxG-C-C family protein [Bacillota bacterium]|nr:C-GCAxxG-C-C family protein [Bacillota bacterium]